MINITLSSFKPVEASVLSAALPLVFKKYLGQSIQQWTK